MKKIMRLAIMILALGFVACGSDDDGDDGSKNCKECEIGGFAATFCDNGDGTITTTAFGQSSVDDIPEGTSFEEFTTTACSGVIDLGL